MTKIELLKLLFDSKIPTVIIGGIALRIYNSPRVTHDIDFAIRSLDIEKVLECLYSKGYYLITSVDDSGVSVAAKSTEADLWISNEKPGSLTFVVAENVPNLDRVKYENIDITSQIDFLYELPIPFPRLESRAKVVDLEGITIKVASPEDLIALKSARSNRSPADDDDIRYLKTYLRPRKKER